MSLKEQINIERLPKHIAVIMDGNGRWAKEQGKPRIFGHRSAIKSVREVSEACAELGVSYLTLYAFSTENWSRPMDEVGGLMKLFGESMVNERETLLKNDVSFMVRGDLARLPKPIYDKMMELIDATKHCKRMELNLALSYSGRWDITQAARKLAQQVKDGKMNPEDIDENTFAASLVTAGMPDPELLIRTSGELRISNFLMWQLAYSELYFTNKYWPDFRKEDLYAAIVDYQHRERRFGKTSEQLSK
ncbi:MAG: isoprenyl transferase [Bacteroidales bacterium]|nr:isoprenyl transferase [Bacteroidales bacterium]